MQVEFKLFSKSYVLRTNPYFAPQYFAPHSRKHSLVNKELVFFIWHTKILLFFFFPLQIFPFQPGTVNEQMNVNEKKQSSLKTVYLAKSTSTLLQEIASTVCFL